MAISVTISLSGLGASVGPFTLLSNASGSFVAFQSGISKTSIQSPNSITVSAPDNTTIIRVQSTGTCSTYIDLFVIGGPLPPTTTTTTSATTSTTSSTTSTTSTSTTSSTSSTTTTTAGPTTTSTTSTSTTTTAEPTTTTSTSTSTTTTEEPTTTTTSSTTSTTSTTSSTTTTTTAEPTTTTTSTSTSTTSTTTEEPTTTTTTTVIPCSQWTNLSGVDAFYDWNDCDGTPHLNQAIPNGISICAQDGTVSFISGGTLTLTGSC